MYSRLQPPGIRVEGLEEKDFQTFRNQVVKLLSNIKSRVEQCGHQPQQPQQQTLSQSSSATSTFVPHTFKATAANTTTREYIFTIPETYMPSSHVIQPAQQSQVATKGQQQQSIGQLTSFLFADDQEAGSSRPLTTFTLILTKHFNPPIVASATGEEPLWPGFGSWHGLM